MTTLLTILCFQLFCSALLACSNAFHVHRHVLHVCASLRGPVRWLSLSATQSLLFIFSSGFSSAKLCLQLLSHMNTPVRKGVQLPSARAWHGQLVSRPRVLGARCGCSQVAAGKAENRLQERTCTAAGTAEGCNTHMQNGCSPPRRGVPPKVSF